MSAHRDIGKEYGHRVELCPHALAPDGGTLSQPVRKRIHDIFYTLSLSTWIIIARVPALNLPTPAKMLHFSEYYFGVTGFFLTSSISSSLPFLIMTFR